MGAGGASGTMSFEDGVQALRTLVSERSSVTGGGEYIAHYDLRKALHDFFSQALPGAAAVKKHITRREMGSVDLEESELEVYRFFANAAVTGRDGYPLTNRPATRAENNYPNCQRYMP